MEKAKVFKKRLFDSIKNNKWQLIILLVIWCVVAVVTLNYYSSSLGMKSFGNYYPIREVRDISKNTTYVENITIEKNIDSIAIEFATYARNNKGQIYIKATGDNTNSVYLDTSINTNEVLDNAFITFGLNEVVDCENDRSIKIIITSNSEEGACAGIWLTNKAFDDSSLQINNKNYDGDIKVRFLRQHNELGQFNKFIIISLIVGITLSILICIISSKAENIFVLLTIIFGLIFMIVITPMSPPDEQKHYEYSYQVSNYIMGKGDNYLLIEHEYQDYTDCAGHLNVSTYYERLIEDFNKKYEHNENYEVIDEGNDIADATYSLCYFPQAIGITIGRLFSLNFFKEFYLGRVFNLGFYATCVYFAIKKTPMHKTLFGIIATMPIFIQQAASYSYDAMLNGLMLIIAAFFFDWYFKEGEIKNKEIVELIIVILLVTPLKRIYSLFVFCFIFIPYEKFGSKKRKIYSLLVLFIPLLIFLINFFLPYVNKFIRNYIETLNNEYEINTRLNMISTDYNAMTEETFVTPEETGDLYYIGHITRNLGEVVKLYIYTIRVSIKNWFYESFGRVLSGVSLVLPTKLTHIMAITLILAAVVKEKFVLPIKERISFALISAIIGLFVMTGMLLTWTCIGDEIVQGMQGRYFSPILFFIMTIINNPKIYMPVKLNKYLIYAQVLIMFETIIYVLSYTFVN